MKNLTLILFLFTGVMMGCQSGDTKPSECEEGSSLYCGFGLCSGTMECVEGEWDECSSVGSDCGECCVCDDEANVAFDCDECRDRDADGYPTLECGGDDCDDQDYLVHPECWDGCDGIDNNCNDVVDEDEGVQECGSTDTCEGWRFCIDGDTSGCSSEGRDCGVCCTCDAEGNEFIDCGTCEEGTVELCGSDACEGFRTCSGDEWSACSTEGNDCGPCCRCDADGVPGEICSSCLEDETMACGSDVCLGIRICSGDEWSACSTEGLGCGYCCICDENGNMVTDCDTCREG